jgi:hypothetical protein
MKKPFTTPRLKNHGALGEITQAFGSSGAADTVEFAGKTFPGSIFGASGSQDGIVGPK